MNMCHVRYIRHTCTSFYNFHSSLFRASTARLHLNCVKNVFQTFCTKDLSESFSELKSLSEPFSELKSLSSLVLNSKQAARTVTFQTRQHEG